MQFLRDKTNISFDEFSLIFPKESEILKDGLNSDGTIIIDTDKEYFTFKYAGFNPISINIRETLKKHEIYFYKNSYYKDPLARAIGLKKSKDKPRVLDATAGMLSDSLLIYSYGVSELVCCERNPVIAALGINAIANSNTKIDYRYGEFLKTKMTQDFDVIFYDPMYYEKNLKTSPKKEMEIFRKLVGADEDATKTASALREIAKDRLVIKRSNKASSILDGVTHTIKGKSTSYDVYL